MKSKDFIIVDGDNLKSDPKKSKNLMGHPAGYTGCKPEDKFSGKGASAPRRNNPRNQGPKR